MTDFRGLGATWGRGAHNRTRTDDLFLTKEVLCQLSYVGPGPIVFASYLVGREGIEPPQPKAAGLQPAELTTCSTYPLWQRHRVEKLRSRDGTRRREHSLWSRRRDSNPEPAVYKTAALPIELRRRDAQGHTAVDPTWRRGMIGPDGSMGQARGVRGARGFRGFATGSGGGPPGKTAS